VSNDSLKSNVYRILNPADHSTWISHAGNGLIIALVLVNLVAMALETEAELSQRHAGFFFYLECFSVAFFTLEYLLRIWSAECGRRYTSRFNYLMSTDSLVDLLAILPFYIGFLLGVDLRIFVTLRLFRLFKLFRYFSPLAVMASVMRAEARAFMAAMLVMFVLVFVCATGIYFFEAEVQPDTLGSIPRALWWSIVTLTTLGYGDIIPLTIGGRIFAGAMTIFAIGVVALPAGMLASRFSEELYRRKNEFRDVLGDMANNGVIDETEEQTLEEIRQRLCLSIEDVRALRKEILRSTPTTAVSTNGLLSCPACGRPVPENNNT